MKNRDLQKLLAKYPPNMEVIITDGFKYNRYHTNGIEIVIFQAAKGAKRVIDIDIGGLDIRKM